MEKKIEVLEKKVAYQGYFQILRYELRHTLFRGGWSEPMVREVFERGCATVVLPYDPERDEVVLIEQFRAGALETGEKAWLFEAVAGIIEVGETPERVARREAEEEAGCYITDLIPIFTCYVSPGGTTETSSLFCGRVNTEKVGGIYGLASEHEDIRVHVLDFYEALEKLNRGEIHSATAIIVLQWLALHRDAVRRRWGVML